MISAFKHLLLPTLALLTVTTSAQASEMNEQVIPSPETAEEIRRSIPQPIKYQENAPLDAFIAGDAVTFDGKPVERIEVFRWKPDGETGKRSGESMDVRRSGSSFRCRVPAGEIGLTITSAGNHRLQRNYILQKEERLSGLTFRLAEMLRVKLKVLDEKGNPIPNAKWDNNKTDHRGESEFELLNSSMHIEAEGFKPELVHPRASGLCEVRLQRLVPERISISDLNTGQPIVGATLTTSMCYVNETGFSLRYPNNQLSGADGIATLHLPKTDFFQVICSHPKYITSEAKLQAGNGPLTMKLLPRTPIRLTFSPDLTDWTEDRRIVYWIDDTSGTVTLGADSSFVIPECQPKDLTLNFGELKYQNNVLKKDLYLHMPDRRRLRIRVKTPPGLPSPKGSIRISSTSHNGASGGYFSLSSEPVNLIDGRAEADILVPGRVSIEVICQDYLKESNSFTFEKAADIPPVLELNLQTFGLVTGTVPDSNDWCYWITCRFSDIEPFKEGYESQHSFTSNRFQIKVPFGRKFQLFYKDQLLSDESIVTPQNPVLAIQLKPARTTPLRCQLRDEAGKPLLQAKVELSMGGCLHALVADENGVFEYKVVNWSMNDSVKLKIEAPELAPLALVLNERDLAQAGAPIPITLRPGLTATGVVLLDGKPFPNCEVRAFLDGKNLLLTTPFKSVTDTEGKFRLTHLPSGKYSLFPNVPNNRGLPFVAGNAEDLIVNVQSTKYPKSSVREKLASIIIPRVNLSHTTVREALEFLARESLRWDSEAGENRGVNIVLQIGAGAATQPEQNRNQGQTRINLHLENASVGEAVRQVAELAGLQVRIDQFAVALLPTLEQIKAADKEVCKQTIERLRKAPDVYFKEAGISFPPGANAEYNPAGDRLTVGNMRQNLDRIDALLAPVHLHGALLPSVQTNSEKVCRKLSTIMIPWLRLQNTTVREVVAFLEVESIRLDPESGPDKGVRMDLQSGPPEHDPAPVRLYLDLTAVPLQEALRYVTEQAGLTYRIENFGVKVIPVSADANAIRLKEYHLPPEPQSGK